MSAKKTNDAKNGNPEEVEVEIDEVTAEESVTEIDENALEFDEGDLEEAAKSISNDDADQEERKFADYKKRTFRDVPDYQQTVQDLENLRKKSRLTEVEQRELAELEHLVDTMDKLIDSIDMDDEMTIINYGSTAFEELQKVADGINDRAMREGVFSAEMDGITSAVADLDWDSFSENAGHWMKTKGVDMAKNNAAATGAGLAAAAFSGPLFWLAGPAAFAGVKGAQIARRRAAERRATEAVTDEDIETELRSVKSKLDGLKAKLESADKKIPEELADLKKLAAARLRSYKRISVYIGAANEKLRQVAETDLADLKAAVEKNPDSWVEQERLEELSRAFDHLDSRITDMETQRTVFISTTMGLKTLRDQYEQAHRKVRAHITQSYPQWCANAAQVAQTLRLADLAKAIESADNFADNMLEQNMKTQETARKQLEASARRGTNDPEKVIKALEQSTKHMKALADFTKKEKQDNQDIRDRLHQAVETNMRASAELQQVKSNKLLGRADDVVNRAKALENKSGGEESKKKFNAAANTAGTEDTGTKAKTRAKPGTPKKDTGSGGSLDF